jgi:putative membrane protein
MMALSAALLLTTTSYAAKALDDGQIARAMEAADEGEVDAAKYVEKRAQNTDVKTFAAMMVNDHKANENVIKDLVKRQDISTASGPEVTQIKDDSKKTYTDLKRQNKSDLDKAYVQSQIDAHQGLLNKIDNDFLPNAQNAVLKSYLTQTRTKVQAHLDRAQEIQKSLQ